MTSRIEIVLDLPRSSPHLGAAEAFWAAALGWPLGDPWPGYPELATFTPPTGDPYVHRQLVDGPGGVHLDLEVPELDAATARLTGLGAELVRRTADWQTLTSPGGLDFCVVRELTGPRPAPVSGPAGLRRRLVQLCLDVPPPHVDAELAFWRAALPWRAQEIDAPEFLLRLVPPPGAPAQLLLQRLGEDDGGVSTRAHLDLGSDDHVADADLLVDLGAVRLHTGDGFVALRDPAGFAFCVTAHSPDRP
jgi:hypothetical protein